MEDYVARYGNYDSRGKVDHYDNMTGLTYGGEDVGPQAKKTWSLCWSWMDARFSGETTGEYLQSSEWQLTKGRTAVGTARRQKFDYDIIVWKLSNFVVVAVLPESFQRVGDGQMGKWSDAEMDICDYYSMSDIDMTVQWWQYIWAQKTTFVDNLYFFLCPGPWVCAKG